VSEWTLEGVSLGVDKARVIDRAVVADFDGDGSKDAVAWTHARADVPFGTPSGELVVFDARSPSGRVIATAPPFVPGGPGCRQDVTLVQTGPHTVTLDVAAHCEAARLARAPTRGLTVLAPAGERPVVLALRVADPAPGEAFTLTVDSRDRDGDGRDDVRVTATMKSDFDALEASADLAWLDRTAGISREAAEPARSLGAIPRQDASHLPTKAASRQMPARIANGRRLYATLCAEGGAPRLFDADGAPLPCSDIGTALAELLVAEVRAGLARHDGLDAAAALGRDGWYQAPLAPRTRAALEKDLASLVPRRTATERWLDVKPAERSALPRWSPLAFEGDTSLLVETADGVVRVRLPGGSVESPGESVAPWPLAVGAGSEARWVGIAFPCDRSEVLLLESDANNTPLPSRPTRLLAPRPGPCRHAAALPAPSVVPVEWSAARRVGLIGGALFGVDDLAELGPTVARGAPRSPDGKVLAAATALGVFVWVSGKMEGWSATEPAMLSDCVPANGATSAACVRGDHAVLLTPDPPPPPRKKR
jgi:hypothetical protein